MSPAGLTALAIGLLVAFAWVIDPRSTGPNDTNDRLTMRFRGTGARIPTLDTVGLVAFALALAFFVVRRRMGGTDAPG